MATSVLRARRDLKVARARLTIAGETGVALLLLFLMIVLYLWADGARRDAIEAQRRAEAQTLVLQDLATGRWVEARERCSG